MDSPLFICWTKTPDVQYTLKTWVKNGDHERVVLVDATTGKEHEAPLDDVSFDDPTAPDMLQALKTVRDFQRHELSRVRRGSEQHSWWHMVFEEMFIDMQHMSSDTSTLFCDGLGPMERRLHAVRANWLKNLADVPEDLRDAKTCALALERDILQYAHVPERHRTEALGAAYLTAKRTKRKRDEEAAAEAEEKAKVDAAAEDKKVKKRATDKVRRDAKKAKADAAGAHVAHVKEEEVRAEAEEVA